MHFLLTTIVFLWAMVPFAYAAHDLTCVSRNVQDAGYYIVADMAGEKTVAVRIEAVNHWTGNKLEYSKISEMISISEDGFCISAIVDNSDKPETIVVVSTHDAPTIEKLNGKTSIRFADLYCEASPRLIEMMRCQDIK